MRRRSAVVLMPRRVAGGRACRLYPCRHADDNVPTPAPRALVGWRLLALLYDALPVVALWMLASTAFTLGYTFLGDHPARENIAPFSALQWLLWSMLLGDHRPVRGAQLASRRTDPGHAPVAPAAGRPGGNVPGTRALWRRYAVASLSLLLGGLGFWWAWIDRDRLAWHDRASGTRLVRLAEAEAGQPERRLNSRYDTSSMISGGMA
jgi:uncharacterized RDD family membrane protein YckC